MPNVMVALPNIGGALCSTPQSLVDTHYQNMLCSNAAKTRNPLKFAGVPQTRQQISAASGPKFGILWGHVLNKLFFRLSIRALVADPRYRYTCTLTCQISYRSVYSVALCWRKLPVLPFFGLRHLVLSPIGSSLRKLNTGAQLQTFPYPTASELFLYSKTSSGDQ